MAGTLAACGGDDGPAASDVTREAAVSVLASTTIWADVVRNVGCGGIADVDTLMPAGADPHGYEPSLRDRERMERADVIVTNGLGLEVALVDTLDALDVSVVHAGDHVEVLAGDPDHDHDQQPDHDHDHEQEHDDADPHIWFDPTRVAATLPAIGDALVAAGADRSAVGACVATYTDDLATLDAQIASTVETLPTDRRSLVTNHHSLGYFADRYGLEVIGTVIPSANSLAATNPADLEALARAIEDAGVPAVFAETQHSSTDTEALAERIGNVDVVTLQTDTLGEHGSATATYVEWLRATAQQIVDALA